jgi:signal transduction histidine kinase
MVEMRRLFGVLHADGEGVSLAPQPGLRQLEVLVEQVRCAGMEVDLSMTGVPRDLRPGLDLTAYRIIQEAATNAMRHSEATDLRIAVAYFAKALEIRVEDNGLGIDNAVRDGHDHGHGLVGLRERAALSGGTVDLVSAPGKGVRLTSTPPLEAA